MLISRYMIAAVPTHCSGALRLALAPREPPKPGSSGLLGDACQGSSPSSWPAGSAPRHASRQQIVLTRNLAEEVQRERLEEKKVEGQVKSVDPSGTEITLADGTKLTTPPRTALKPGVLAEGAIVVASYREENGKKVLTGLALKETGEPSTAPPGQSPSR